VRPFLVIPSPQLDHSVLSLDIIPPQPSRLTVWPDTAEECQYSVRQYLQVVFQCIIQYPLDFMRTVDLDFLPLKNPT
jgi:hypothetical protein